MKATRRIEQRGFAAKGPKRAQLSPEVTADTRVLFSSWGMVIFRLTASVCKIMMPPEISWLWSCYIFRQKSLPKYGFGLTKNIWWVFSDFILMVNKWDSNSLYLKQPFVWLRCFLVSDCSKANGNLMVCVTWNACESKRSLIHFSIHLKFWKITSHLLQKKKKKRFQFSDLLLHE